MKLDGTRICIKCKEIWYHIKALRSGTPIKVCPCCGGTDTVMLTTYIDTVTEYAAKGTGMKAYIYLMLLVAFVAGLIVGGQIGERTAKQYYVGMIHESSLGGAR